jgi:hypothetical protein
MRVGFTGSREGITAEQLDVLRRWLKGWVTTNPRESLAFHHGACLGADAQAVDALDRIWPVPITAHPTTFLTSENALRLSAVVLDPKPPLDRNRDIVDATDVLVACPHGPEEWRSGTWATIRYARKCGKRVVICWPDGTASTEG